MAKGLEIKEFTGRGYKGVHVFKTWRVAFLTQDEEYTKNTYIERHMESDEVFVLLQGEATLFIGKEREPVAMEKNKIYNVTAGTWHSIECDEQASVLIIENDDTVKENSEYMDL